MLCIRQWLLSAIVLLVYLGCQTEPAHTEPKENKPAESPEDKGESQVSDKGIPPGWDGIEMVELRQEPWRFYRIELEDEYGSVLEDNLAVKGNQPKAGLEGMAEFIEEEVFGATQKELQPSIISAQLALFMVHGDSRQSCLFQVVVNPTKNLPGFEAVFDKLHEPVYTLTGDLFELSAWVKRDGYLQHLVVSAKKGESPKVEFTEKLSKEGPIGKKY